MTNLNLPRKLRLPSIEKVRLRRFSLYEANPNAEFSCGTGVLCLVGANGIGKSTLLAAINFCLTGIVPDRNRTFQSMEEYYRYTKTFSSSYFRGRISPDDEDDVEITVTFLLGPFRYEVTRNLFEPDELRGLVISDASGVAVSTETATRGERHAKYVEHLLAQCGLTSFAEFVFLQHFVFTFDEQRKTLFWNSAVLGRVLYHAFGLDSDMAKKADSMKREIDQEDSRVRNYQWEATKMRKRIVELQAQANSRTNNQQTYDSLVEKHKDLSARFDDDSKALREVDDALRDANLRLAEFAAKESSLRDEYARIFEQRFGARLPLMQHPVVAQSLGAHICDFCGSSSDSAIEAIKHNVSGATCPLCDSEISREPANEESAARLRDVDAGIAIARKGMNDAIVLLDKLRKDEALIRERCDSTKRLLDEFDQQNSSVLDSLRQQLGHQTSASLADYRTQLALVDRDKKVAFQKREELKETLRKLQMDLEQQYLAVEKDFVPQFSELARQFLGMPLTVQLDARTLGELKLVVEVRGSPRRQQQNLSESQQFFLDIALRMALTTHMSDDSSKGGMLIDTPEGSLDIAYEKRAGDMLAMFAAKGHQVVMTANLNTSQLLLALARTCGKQRMRLCRMTDWAELSEVQQQEEQLFADAYQKIEAEMGA